MLKITEMILLLVGALFISGCTSTSTQLPDGSYDRERGVPIRAMNSFYLVTVLPDKRRIYWDHVQEENARCFIILKPADPVSFFFLGVSTRQHWVCALKKGRHWVLVETREGVNAPRIPLQYKFGSEREAFIYGKNQILKRAMRYR